MAFDRATHLRRLARTPTERFDLHRHGVVTAESSGSARVWTFAWTDGPVVAQVRGACREAEPEAGEGLRSVLFFGSALDISAALISFRAGRRTPLELFQ